MMRPLELCSMLRVVWEPLCLLGSLGICLQGGEKKIRYSKERESISLEGKATTVGGAGTGILKLNAACLDARARLRRVVPRPPGPRSTPALQPPFLLAGSQILSSTFRRGIANTIRVNLEAPFMLATGNYYSYGI